MKERSKIIGHIISADAFNKYVVRVFKKGETDPSPKPEDYTPASFVIIKLNKEEELKKGIVGIISDVMLYNPDYSEYLSAMEKKYVEVFSPDLYHEQATLLIVLAVGSMERKRDKLTWRQEIVGFLPDFHAEVFQMREDEIRSFHYPAPEEKKFLISYLPYLKKMREFQKGHLLHAFLDKLSQFLPEQKEKIKILQKQMDWELRMKSL